MTVCVHGRWHAFELANGLFKRGLLNRLLTTYPALIARRNLDPGVNLKTAPWLEARRRCHDRFSIGGKPDIAIARAFGRFAARQAIGGADILVGWSSATLEAMAPARAAGMKVVIERGSSHIGHQCDVLRLAQARFKMPFSGPERQIIERELAEYAAADLIAVPSHFAAATFTARGVNPGKLLVNPYGVDLSRFSPGPPIDRPLPRILFVGSVGVRKGVPYLLDAFKGLEKVAELHLIGPVERGFDKVLAAHDTKNVYVRGALPGPVVADEFKRSDIFCLPSLEEGFPLSLLQAMASGLAVVVTPETGAADIIGDGQGLIVDSQDHRPLHHALLQLIQAPERRRAMGAAARARIAGGYSWDDYITRTVNAYQTLIGGGA